MNYKIVLVSEKEATEVKETIVVSEKIAEKVEPFIKSVIKKFTNGELDTIGESENFIVERIVNHTKNGIDIKYSIIAIKYTTYPILVKL